MNIHEFDFQVALPLSDNPDKGFVGDVNAPWRCVAGAIYNVQISGYPTVGFISNPINPDEQ